MKDSRPLVMHIVYSFDVGGLENGIVNIINGMSAATCRHTVVALTHCAETFCRRIMRDDVDFISLAKAPGHGVQLYPRLFRLFAELRPALVHTRNLAALEAVVPARAAGVPVRLHGEHGWDTSDPDGRRRKYRLLRRLYRPLVSHYVALSGELERYLRNGVGVPTDRLSRICNGVDTNRFAPAQAGCSVLDRNPFVSNDVPLVVGTVGRLEAVKDQVTLVRAFARLAGSGNRCFDRLRLAIAGEGPQRGELEAAIREGGVGGRVWLAGERTDVPDVMRSFDLFVLPSRAEGISNTILEAMASGLPVLATAVGGNSELVAAGETGLLVPAADDVAMADGIACYVLDPALRIQHGDAGRRRVISEFSLDGMVERYRVLYETLFAAATPSRSAA